MENDPHDTNLDRLFTAARQAEVYDPKREFGFEARVMAKIIAEREGEHPFLFWAWRLITVFSLLVVSLGIWVYLSEPGQLGDIRTIAHLGNEEPIVIAFWSGE